MNPSATSDAASSSTSRLRWLSFSALILIVCIGAFLRLDNLHNVASRSLDEQSYTEGANAVLDHGTAGLAALREMVRGDEMSAHNPVRAGYLYLLAAAMQLTGNRDIAAGANISCIASIASLILLTMLAWRRFSPPVALVATLLYAVSPLPLMTARRTWEESLVELLALTMIFIAAEITAGARHPLWLATFALIGMYGITVKQTAGLGFFLCTLWILAVLIVHRERRQAMIVAATCTACALIAIGFLAHVLGGVQTVIQLSSMKSLDTNPYSIVYEGGEPWQLLHGLWTISAITTILAAIALFSALDLRRPLSATRQTALALVLFSAAYVVPAMVLPHHLNLRYIAAGYAPMYLLAGLAFSLICHLIRKYLPTESGLLLGICSAVVVIMACLDYHHFRASFVARDVRDLSIRMVLEAAGEPAPVIAAPAPSEAARLVAFSASAQAAGNCQSAVDAATRASQLEPNNAAAWNNIASGYECLRQWSPAIAAAQRALQIQPDFQLARNNLNWSISQQQKEAAH